MMINLRYISVLLFLIVSQTTIFALEQYDGNLSLAQDPPAKMEVFGVIFGDNTTSVTKKLASMGMTMKTQKIVDSEGLVQLLSFEGAPEHLSISEGESQFLFFRDQLIRMDILFKPSYENFLVVRNQLFSTLGNRFEVNEKKEVMDQILQSHLANLSPNEYNDESEKAISRAMTEGSTFFFYKIKDIQDELNISYSFYNPSNPELRLHYSVKEGMNQFKTHQEKKQTNY